MDSLFITILIAVFLGSVVSLAGGILLLGIPQRAIKRIAHVLTAFAAGSLLAVAILDLLPEAIEMNHETAGIAVLVGILLFYLFERLNDLFHRHHHDEGEIDHDHEDTTVVPLVITGELIHNFIDGAVIAISFLVSPELGIVAAITVGLHEIPTEMGEFALLLSKGMKKSKVFLINILSSLTAFLGAGLAYVVAERFEVVMPWLLGGTAGFFLYIALADLKMIKR